MQFFFGSEFFGVNPCSTSIVGQRLADCVEHFVIDEKFEKEEGDDFVVEDWVDPNLAVMPIVESKCKGAEFALRSFFRPPDGDLFFIGKVFRFYAAINLV